MKIHLLVLTPGKSEGKLIPINVASFVVGRDPQCHLRPASPIISKRHCAVLVRGGKVFLHDFGSTNGTFLNGRQIKGEIELQNDDRLKIGPLEFAVRLEAGTPASATAPSRNGTTGAPDDEAAALLLSPEGEVARVPNSPGVDGQGIPTGSTEIILRPPELEGPPSEPAKDDPAKTKLVKAPLGDTSSAAKSILDKYLRRPRG